ncbi:hypothetical protein [Rheinheimera maricola]|uniref:Uncharacterized protein n=1 Tax=Rheinheimera maricola TaxID=2793282 RepID=A0ABS7X574_9GAMM|nr:hypothetical protein [Rheinheimera maricola]MBZ9610687.1 hypothetical protein [Rheinheimera maricola]
MLWELIATVVAGLGGAGIALILRKLSANKTPRWLMPVFAGATMLGFQIHSEYSWFDHQASLLPAGVVVVKKVQEQAVWRPWSYLYPQTLRFIAADTANASVNQINPQLKLVDLYFFERRATARRVSQVVHCQQQAQTNFSAQLQIPAPNAPVGSDWKKLSSDDALLIAVCNS